MLKTAKTKEEIPQAFQAGAIETKDGFVYLDNTALKSQVDTLIGEKRGVADQLDAIKKALGDHKPEDIANAIAEKARAEEELAKKSGNFDELLRSRLEKQRNELLKEYEPKIKAGEESQRNYEKLSMRVDIQKGLHAAKVDPDDLDTVTDMLIGTGRVKYVEGKIVAYDKDGDPVSGAVGDYLGGAWKNENKKFFLASGSSGGGAGGGGNQPPAAKGAAKVAATDEAGFLANLSGIAKGETVVAF